jgi:hypothetical protein
MVADHQSVMRAFAPQLLLGEWKGEFHFSEIEEHFSDIPLDMQQATVVRYGSRYEL